MPDGSVELTAEGPRDSLQQLMEWCLQGPPGARVTSVEPTWGEATGEFRRFAVRY
jgi:acylphosphatase